MNKNDCNIPKSILARHHRINSYKKSAGQSATFGKKLFGNEETDIKKQGV